MMIWRKDWSDRPFPTWSITFKCVDSVLKVSWVQPPFSINSFLKTKQIRRNSRVSPLPPCLSAQNCFRLSKQSWSVWRSWLTTRYRRRKFCKLKATSWKILILTCFYKRIWRKKFTIFLAEMTNRQTKKWNFWFNWVCCGERA